MRLEFEGREFAELVAEKIADRLLAREDLISRIADAIALRLELLTPAEAAAFLDVTTRTLADNHVDWSLDKSIAFGATNPRYFLSQVLERARKKVIKGKQLPPPRTATSMEGTNAA